MTKAEVLDSFEKVLKEATILREKLIALKGLRDYRQEYLKHTDMIIHECRMNYESMTGGFYYDPANVLSRKIVGG